MRRTGERGFTLAEVLVAVTVMAIVFVVVFSLYDSLQKSFKNSENAASQQQNTRVAFDRMIADVRMAGFNHNPDGDPARPDEQIEGMWDTAITVRGDFDFEDATARVNPESTLGGPSATFRTVTIGNDEIVTYALGKTSGTGGASISFVADVAGVPRNGTQETVTIANVHTAQTDPPYTLYRYTVAPNSASVVKQPVADNIKSMSFTYYDGNGSALSPVGGADDPNSLAARKRITKIGINVVGMTEDPDLAYIDPMDANAPTRHHRKFTLQSDVTPRNLGYVGVVDIDLDDPNAPVNFTACQGHCNGTFLKWQSGGDPDIASYTVSWGTSASNLINVISTPDTFHYVSGITGAHYYAARSVDLTGNQSGNVTVGPSTPTDTTTPAQVSGAACSGDAGGNLSPLDSVVQVSWSPLGGNTVNLSCDQSPFPIRDLKGYRVYKGATASFDPNNVSQVIESWDPNTVTATVNALTDSNVVNCRQYYYKVLGEDLCSKRGAVSAAADGASTTSIPPAAPTSVSATDMGLNLHRVTWNRVSQNSDTTPANIMIDKYAVYRAVVDVGDDPNQATFSQVFSGLVANPSSPYWEDSSVPNIPGSQRYWYKITALDDCPNESALSLPDEADKCNFGGTIFLNISPGGNPMTGNQTITLSVSGGVGVQSTQLIIRNASTGTVVHNQTDSTSPYTYTWNASAVASGQSYEVIGLVTNTSGCTDWATTTVTTTSAIACCISTNNPNISPTTGSLKNNEVFFDIINNCGDQVTIDDLSVIFTNNANQNPLLDEIDWNIFSQITARRTFNFSPDLASGVILNFASGSLSPPLVLDKNNDGSRPVRVSYNFTKPMLNKVGSTFVGESIRTGFFFTLASSSGTGRCEVTVVTNPLSVVSCDPASDPNCGI
ncbi:MAG TPA: prepilin-type N-terminal cleavage/methylation domain-containing protein [Candidatus Polarisedimenticolia bacterium]|nr:prepilin-type N-terminal cleavage/methylation domain-containing protein [Candidatus Polarisedimenticolia bacterium]